jgi:hypothetical protein
METLNSYLFGIFIFGFWVYATYLAKIFYDALIASLIPLSYLALGVVEDAFIQMTLYQIVCFVCGALILWRINKRRKG